MLTIPDICTRLHISRSTAFRMLRDGRLTGQKRHPCGTICGDPLGCKHGTWEFTEEAVKAALALPETGR